MRKSKAIRKSMYLLNYIEAIDRYINATTRSIALIERVYSLLLAFALLL